MKLPAVEIPEQTSDAATKWAYRIGTLPFEATVDQVAMIIEAARQEAVEQAKVQR